MGSLFGKFFGQAIPESEDDVLGCDMAPAPSVLATVTAPSEEGEALRPQSKRIGPFTTSAQAPIRDS